MCDTRPGGGGSTAARGPRSAAVGGIAAVLVILGTACSGAPALLGDSGAVGETATVQEQAGTPTAPTRIEDLPSAVETTIPGQQGADQGGATVYFNPEIGDCARLWGPFDDPEAERVPCGSPASMYRVIAKVPHADECPVDIDSSYWEYQGDSDEAQYGAVCMDVDWVVGGCMSGPPPDSDTSVARDEEGNPLDEAGDGIRDRRVACDDRTAANVVRVVSIVPDAGSVAVCPSGVSGFVYDVRRFVVCVEEL